MLEATSAPEIAAIAKNYDKLSADSESFARTLLIELLAFQFASPVRWIETQDVLFKSKQDGGLDVKRVVEIGVGYQPTVANMAKQTLAMVGVEDVLVHNLGADTDVVLARDQQQTAVVAQDELANEAPTAPKATPSAATATAPAPAAAPQTNASAPADRPYSHADGLRLILALQARVQPTQVKDTENIDELFGGVSSRRNQVLVDIGAEFGIGAIDGAHEKPINQLAAEIAKRAPAWSCPGPYLGKSWDEAVRKSFGRARIGRREIGERLHERFGMQDGLVKHFFSHLTATTRDGESSRGGELGVHGTMSASGKGDVDTLLDAVCTSLASQLGISLAPLAVAGGGGSAVDAAVVAELEDRILGSDGVLMRGLRDMAEQLGHPVPGAAVTIEEEADDGKAARAAATIQAEHGERWAELIAPRFSAKQHVALTSAWAWAQRDLAELCHSVLAGQSSISDHRETAQRLAKFAGQPRLVKTALWYAGVATKAGDKKLAKLLSEIGAGAVAKQPSVIPSKPSLTIGPNGVATYHERPDNSANGTERWLREMFARSKGQSLVSIGDKSVHTLWQKTLKSHTNTALSYTGQTALVTGASPGSIAVEVVRHLLLGGAKVVITTSSPRPERMAWYRRLYQDNCTPGAQLHVLPFNAASNQDVDALVQWLFSAVNEQDGANVRNIKPPFAPDIVVPFAAIGDMATLDQLGPRAEMAMRAMLFSVERLVAGIGAHFRDNGMPARPCHILLPLSPNHGGFGGDGAYAETKAALEVLSNKWQSERDAWAAATTLCAAKIGWVRGTGLMDANDPVAAALEERTGARTFSNAEMGWLLASLCSDELRQRAEKAPVQADLTGGFAAIGDVRAVVGKIREDLGDAAQNARRLGELRDVEAARLGRQQVEVKSVTPLPQWPSEFPDAERLKWPKVKASLEQTVVVVGAAELGPCGSSRTRWAFEVQDKLAPAAVLELAWICGLIRYEDGQRAGHWVDAESGEEVTEDAIADRYREAVRGVSGIRWTEPETAGFDAEALPVLATAYLDRDFTFSVSNEQDARSFKAADPAMTEIAYDDVNDVWQVTRKTGAEIRVPKIARMSRRILGAVPNGFDIARMGIPGEMLESVDRTALFNLIATADAFLSAGMTPEELLTYVHPTRVANTQGSGIGGMRSLQRLYTDYLLDRQRQNDSLQETLINVIASYVVQSYVGSYGPMVHPVGACATAAVSLEEGMDKILADRAEFVVAGGFDDVGPEGAVGFQDMGATCDTDQMLAMGLQPHQMSRANDVRRRGFVEAQGGGTLLLCRGDVAAEMGLPVRGVLAWAGSFGDGLHKSVPAPGLGIVAAAMGGKKSPLGRALSRFGMTADDIAVVYKHDTSTSANDVNENNAHNHIQRSLGRTEGNPLFVVSQKTLTGHSKGGAAAWQSIGLCQSMASGTVAGNRNLDSVDPKMAQFDHIAFTDHTMRLGSGAVKAGLVTSLGFGHVGAVALMLHPSAFEAMLGGKRGKAWRKRVKSRQRWAQRQRAQVLMGRRALFERRDEKRFVGEAELHMLLDPTVRLASTKVEPSS